ncbi:MAG: ribosome silencing factor [Alphaproteobacteria bacterium]
MDRLLALIETVLADGKAEDVIAINLAGKSTMADYMVIATAMSQRQVNALAQNLVRQLKLGKFGAPNIEGRTQGDWVLLDAGDIIVHLFRPEVRAFYNLEKMWTAELPDGDETTAATA